MQHFIDNTGGPAREVHIVISIHWKLSDNMKKLKAFRIFDDLYWMHVEDIFFCLERFFKLFFMKNWLSY